MSEGNYMLSIQWPSGKHTSNGMISDEQYGEICKILAPDWTPPSSLEGVEVVAWRHFGDRTRLLSDIGKQRAVPGGTVDEFTVPLMTVTQHIAALSAVTAERDRLQQFEAAYNEWHDKTEWVQKTAKAHELGKHRADVLKDRVDKIQAEVEALRALLSKSLPVVEAHAGASHMLEGFRPIRNKWDELVDGIRAAMAAKEA
jgi:hypothetical protein